MTATKTHGRHETRPPSAASHELVVTYQVGGEAVTALRGVSVEVAKGEVVALVGESGSGKSTLARVLNGTLPGNARIRSGTAEVDGNDVTRIGERQWRQLRGRTVAHVPQDPGTSLDPTMTIGRQIAEVLRIHRIVDDRAVASRVESLLETVGIDRPSQRVRQLPHELSGGMRQRVLIAMAIAASPALIVADEPTSALDATVGRRVMDHLERLVRDSGASLLLITHDLGLAAERADRIVVLQHGQVVEAGPAEDVFRSPEAAYTKMLVGHARSLRSVELPASVPVDDAPPSLVVDGASKVFHTAGRAPLQAVDGVSFTIPTGTTLGLLGESGSGKSTTARMIVGLETPTSGDIVVSGERWESRNNARSRRLRRHIQFVYQNPDRSLDPRLSVRRLVEEPLRWHRIGDAATRDARVRNLLDRVELPQTLLSRRPRELSGGQRQRVAIARALATEPALVVLDEPVSGLDVAVQDAVLDLLRTLQNQLRLSYLFISHDLAVVASLAHQVGVMRAGRLVELGPAGSVLRAPEHPYTQELVASVPGARRYEKENIR